MEKSIKKYFKLVDKSYFFIGKKLTIKIPRRYEVHNCLTVSDTVTTLAIFSMTFDDKEEYGYFLPGIINTQPSKTYKLTENETDYLVCEYQTGDIFITSKSILRQAFIAYVLFVECYMNGNIPDFMSYNDSAFIFDKSQEVCDFNIGVKHASVELINAHNARDSKNLNIRYRYTDMKTPPAWIGFRNIGYGTDSTTTKLIGSYLPDGVNSAIVNTSHEHHEMEDILRS